MTGYVAVTDYDWYSFLRLPKDWEEVNFWQPSSHGLLDPPRGMPFFFKLKNEYGSPIVGFGYFSWRSKLPAWMAWDTFGAANGAPDRNSMLARISRLRRDPAADPAGGYEIGCLLIASPVFFDEHLWVRAPIDWPQNVQRGKSYDITFGEGRRIYEECLARASSTIHNMPENRPPVTDIAPGLVYEHAGERFGKPYVAKPRLGQGGFRVAVSDIYRRRCAISSEHSLPALEAAHIKPYAQGGAHDL